MHPAPSVILFTTLSGLGFGLLAFLGLGLPPVTGWVAFVFFLLAYALAVGGLLASVGHLANPKNAIKAFREWRSSWLSREGVFAVDFSKLKYCTAPSQCLTHVSLSDISIKSNPQMSSYFKN